VELITETPEEGREPVIKPRLPRPAKLAAMTDDSGERK
jgi:hypothetical protein